MRVGRGCHVARSSKVTNQDAHRLSADPCLSGEIADSGARRFQPGEDGRVGDMHLGVALRPQRVEQVGHESRRCSRRQQTELVASRFRELDEGVPVHTQPS